MFLSEKFEQIQNNTDYTLEEKIKAFLEAIADSIRNENKCERVKLSSLEASAKRIDNTWRTFAKKYGYKEDFAKRVLNDAFTELNI